MLFVNFLNGLNNTYLPPKSNIHTAEQKSNYVNTITQKPSDVFEKNSNSLTATKPNEQKTQNLFSSRQQLKNYLNKDYLKFLINSNPQIAKIFKENNLDLKINPKNVSDIANTHLETTNQYAQQIADEMGLSQAEKQLLEQAGIFHDFGKTLIPEEILNKPESLNDSERKIINLHAELGYQLLKNTKLTTRVLNIVRNHHKPVSENKDTLGQILSVADIYSALREERCYKKPMSQEKAFEILDKKVQSGELSIKAVQALKQSLNEEEIEAA